MRRTQRRCEHSSNPRWQLVQDKTGSAKCCPTAEQRNGIDHDCNQAAFCRPGSSMPAHLGSSSPCPLQRRRLQRVIELTQHAHAAGGGRCRVLSSRCACRAAARSSGSRPLHIPRACASHCCLVPAGPSCAHLTTTARAAAGAAAAAAAAAVAAALAAVSAAAAGRLAQGGPGQPSGSAAAVQRRGSQLVAGADAQQGSVPAAVGVDVAATGVARRGATTQAAPAGAAAGRAAAGGRTGGRRAAKLGSGCAAAAGGAAQAAALGCCRAGCLEHSSRRSVARGLHFSGVRASSGSLRGGAAARAAGSTGRRNGSLQLSPEAAELLHAVLQSMPVG